MTYDPKRSRPRPAPSADAAPVDAILGGPDEVDAPAPRSVEAPAVTPPPVGASAELPAGWLDGHRNEAIAAAVVAALILVLVVRMRRSDGD